MTTFDSTPTGDKPRQHLAPRGNGGDPPPETTDAANAIPGGNNPQSTTPGWTPARRRRWDFLRSNLADKAAHGHTLSADDLAALPEAHRDAAKTVAEQAIELHSQGDQLRAVEAAREGFLRLEQAIGKTWTPPREERPDADLIDAIRASA